MHAAGIILLAAVLTAPGDGSAGGDAPQTLQRVAEPERAAVEQLWTMAAVQEGVPKEEKPLAEFLRLDGEGRVITVSLPEGSNDDFLSVLLSLGRLQHLDLSKTEISGEGIAQLIILPSLTDLDLSITPITDEDLDVIQGMRDLVRLNLSGTSIGDEGVARLADLTNLQELRLDGTGVSDAGLAHLANLKQLRRVSLVETSVTEEGAETLKTALSRERPLTARSSFIDKPVIHYSTRREAEPAGAGDEDSPGPVTMPEGSGG